MSTRTMSRLLPIAAAAMALATLAGGCGSQHGKYTGEFKQEASERMSRVKAGTEWDMAHQQFLAGDLEKALKGVDQSIAMAPNVPKSHVLRGRIMFEMGRLEAALASFNDALAIDPNFTDAHYYSGMVYERFAQYDKALACYKAAMAIDGSNPQYTVAAAEMLIDQQQLDEARTLLTSGTTDFEHNAGVRQTLGHIAMMQGRVEDAVTLFGEACLLAPDEDSLLEDLARAQIASRRFSDAEYCFRRLLAKDKEGLRRDLRHLQARCLVEIEKPVEARSILQEIVNDSRGQNDIQAWIELGNIAVMLKDERRLRDCATRLIAISPERQEGYFLMATWQKNKGNLKGAIASLDKAIERANGDAGPAVMQGLLYQELGMNQQAVHSYQVAIKTNPNDNRAQALLSRAGGQTQLTGVPSSKAE